MVPNVLRSAAVMLLLALIVAACKDGPGDDVGAEAATRGMEKGRPTALRPALATAGTLDQRRAPRVLQCGNAGYTSPTTSEGPIAGTTTGPNTAAVRVVTDPGHRLLVKRGVVPARQKLRPWIVQHEFNRAIVEVFAFRTGGDILPGPGGSKPFTVRLKYGPCNDSHTSEVVIVRLNDNSVIAPDSQSTTQKWADFSIDRFSTYAVAAPDR